MYLELINKANDIKKLSPDCYPALAREIRKFLLQKVSKTGGHLASNLGVVELTMAIHLALDMEKDQVIWDVGHQAYVHKILTGRKNRFDTLRQSGGLSGFPKRRESRYDVFSTGHSSTSISAALGLAMAAQLDGDDRTIVAVIGDGAMTGGLAFEGLNNLSKLKRNLIIILNDNNMSISQNVGGMSAYLSTVRAGESYNDLKAGVVNTLEKIPRVGEKMVKDLRKTKSSLKQFFVPGMLFENIGLTYLGPFDGHDTRMLVRILKEARSLDRPVVLHVQTKKGRGYSFAEKDPGKFHGIAPFDLATGEVLNKGTLPSYTKVFSDAIVKAAGRNRKIIAITAAMPDGTGLKEFAASYPDRFYDVGIAEEHAVTFAAGLAVGGYKPFVAIYSSFLQRAFDQVIHDVCMQNLPVTFCIDRAGLVGNDGETHHGILDYSYLSLMPNMNVMAPKNADELADMIAFAADFNAPLAIRYPRGSAYDGLKEYRSPIVYGKSEVICLEQDIALFAVGSMVETAVQVRKILKAKGYMVSLINARFIKPLDEEMIDEVLKHHTTVVTLEENVIAGGFGVAVLNYINKAYKDIRVFNYAIPVTFVEQGSQTEQRKECGLDAEEIAADIEEKLADS